ncbi:PD-(D/E)XK nuclease family transposase [Clostridium saccharobutylicum]|uniref:PD-(D/E)XK nuclease family transposase n=1 Tax=Clostridium saccharobutylicum TaxID=169679 RepID=A0A1S8MQ62_CLOSA|nr:PD-(D/E)XK nuclease family transposase [Clostridium saccharobutylicum]OOM06333.1 PD-(D/E)XK nuclease family transposase [Clostridium saccharobutylicum]
MAKIEAYNDGFIMSPKNDFVFKLLFGDEKNKDLLIELLNSILNTPHDELEDLELINTELLREFAEDRKGILEEKNEKIRKAYNILEVISKDDNARAAYEAREAELHDQMTRLKSAREEGKEEGIKEGIKEAKIKNAKNFLLLGLNLDIVAKGTGLSIEEIQRIKKEMI